nr:MAG TPA: hypothetical protein [Caudoviricetes sp.]
MEILGLIGIATEKLRHFSTMCRLMVTMSSSSLSHLNIPSHLLQAEILYQQTPIII